jgi:hypothetical protein
VTLLKRERLRPSLSGAGGLSYLRTSGNEPFGSRPEPGTRVLASILQLTPGEVPEGRARGVQDTASQVLSESEA